MRAASSPGQLDHGAKPSCVSRGNPVGRRRGVRRLEPTYTWPLEMAGEEVMGPPVVADHSGGQLAGPPQPAAAMAYRLSSLEPT
jgi:hypothetical protein